MGAQPGVKMRLRWTSTVMALLLLAASGAPVRAQVDTLPPTPPDSAGASRADTLDASSTEVIVLNEGTSADTTFVLPPDSIYRVLPRLMLGAEGRPETGVTVWGRDDLLGNPALTLLDLLAQEPDLLPLRYGDFGVPEAVLGPGLEGGRVRVFTDGWELPALTSSNPDLALIALGGLEEVRVERGGGELRIHLTSLTPDDPRPMSRVEAGTGDLDTNLFRGVFLHPRALGGSLGVTIERLDSQGRGGDEPGVRQGVWVRYAVQRSDRRALAFDLRQTSAKSELDIMPPNLGRTEWTLRGRTRVVDSLTAEVFVGGSSLKADDDGLTPVGASHRQYGLRLALDRPLGPAQLWTTGAYRAFGGNLVPDRRLDLSGGVQVPGIGGLSVESHRDQWQGTTLATSGLKAWTAPVFGLSFFGAWDSGQRGSRFLEPRVEVPAPELDSLGNPVTDPLLPDSLSQLWRLSDRTALRAGARLDLGPLDLTGAWHRIEADSLMPLFGLATRSTSVLSRMPEATGYEVSGRLALPVIQGLSLVGTLMQWDTEGAWRPKRRYTGGFDFAGKYYQGDQLEIRAQVKVEGRDPMLIPWVDPAMAPTAPGEESAAETVGLLRVPFYQSWNAWLHIRIQSVRVFIRWENLFLRRNNQDFPDRILPRTRAIYGVRWTLWN